MILLTVEVDNLIYTLCDSNIVDISSDGSLIKNYIGSGIKSSIEKKLNFSDKVKLLRHNDVKNKDSFYNPYTKGVIELDLAMYPSDQHRYQYCYTFVDIKTRIIFVMSTRDRTASTTLKALNKAWEFYDKDIKMLSVDRGGEFVNKEVKKFTNDHNIALNIGMTNRRFNGIVESYIGFIKKYVNEKLGENQLNNVKYWNQWRKYVDDVVEEINEHNKKKFPLPYSSSYDSVQNVDNDVQIGDLVHVKLDYPATISGKRVHGDFRYGDLHFTDETYPISKIILRNNDVEPRYKVSGLKFAEKTSFKRSEIIKKNDV
jgi:hypothetical protein